MSGGGYETLVDQTTGRVVFARSLTVEQLIDGARRGYNAYIGELQRRFGPNLVTQISHVAGELSHEIVDDVFMTLPRRLAMYVEDGKFEGWLYGIAFNLARTRMRSERRRREEPMQEWDEDPARQQTGPFRLIESETMERAAASLPVSEREAWMLAYRGYEAAEIGKMLNITANAAAVRIHRARKRLEKLFPIEER